jgi:hypothetical protein
MLNVWNTKTTIAAEIINQLRKGHRSSGTSTFQGISKVVLPDKHPFEFGPFCLLCALCPLAKGNHYDTFLPLTIKKIDGN